MTRAMVADVYSSRTAPVPRPTTPHPKQIRRRRAFRVPRDAFDPNAPDILRVTI